MKNMFRLAVAIALLAATLPSSGSAYSFSAWGTMTGAKTLAVNPFLYSAVGPFDATLDLVAGYGITDKIDVFANIAGVYYDGYGKTSVYGSWIMPRYDLGGNNVVALMAVADYGEGADPSFRIWPQYHFFWENDTFAAEINAGVDIPVAAPVESSVSVYLAPVWKIKDGTFHAYCELDPSYTSAGAEKGFDLAVLPGLWFGFGEEALHQFSLAASISGWWNDGDIAKGRPSYGVNLWYWTTFSLGE
jgi:hypothetical protein